MVFFKKYLGGLVRERPLMAPPMYTVNDFFYRVYNVSVTDRLRLLLELYQCYKALNPEAEPLDDFVFWGDVILADFDDVDKYLADPAGLFRNVSEFKEIQDQYTYLSENQSIAIEHFLSHFKDGKTGVKASFVKLWNLLLPLYNSFNERLRSEGMAYEGMVYRSLAARIKDGEPVQDILSGVFPSVTRFVFVGLNALNECERLLLRRMRDAGIADFVWDYVPSYFMKRNLEDFPQAFPLDTDGVAVPKITVVDVPSSVGQAKLAPWILSQTSGDPVQTAFVLPDETLLLPLLNSIPPEYDNVNVTMGYPMSGSAVYTLLDILGRMQLKLRRRQDGWYFYHRPVHELFSSALFRELLSPGELKVLDKVKAQAKYYIPASELHGGPVLDMVFRAVTVDVKAQSAAQNHELERYFLDVVSYVGRTLTGNSAMLLELDFAKRCHTQLNILQDIDLQVLASTHLRLLERVLQGISVPFRGEPLNGLQVMGLLETRALDFRYLVVMSANEGMFPRRSVSSSFIPPELRKGFGLPTYEYQDAVWSYYFYRMIRRPEHVWLVYDSRTEGLKAGEESRFIKQLQYNGRYQIERLTAVSLMEPPRARDSIPKTQEDVDAILSHSFSATALKNYLDCPAKFYYQSVKGLSVEDDVAESLDSRTTGNVFHHVMEELYGRAPLITRAMLEGMIADTAGLKALVRRKILEEMRSFEVTGRNLVLENVILDYVVSTLRHDDGLLSSASSPGFRIISLEKEYRGNFEGFRIKGFMDRVDSYRDGQVRIVDYKTGRVEEADVDITDANALKVADLLFGPKNTGRPKIALQLFIYDSLAAQSLHGYPERVNAIYSTGRMFTGALPEVPESAEFVRIVRERLLHTLQEIVNPAIPFARTTEKDTCKRCDFKDICGR